MPPQRIRVRVAGLIEAVEARKREVIELAAEAEKEYPIKLSEWHEGELAKVREAEASIANGRRPDNIYWLSPPPKGTKPNLSQYDRSLATLRMAVDDAISITAEDYAAFIK